VRGARNPGRFQVKSAHGFSMIELMVVMAIVAILATGVVFMFANPTAKVKTQAFELLAEINYARSVSVSENQSVLVDFSPVFGADDSYRICFDDTPAGGDGNCGNEPADNILKDVILRQDVQFYNFTVDALPADGPAKTPPYATQTAGMALTNQDGVILDSGTFPNTLLMQPDGTCNKDGAVIIYLHAQGDRRKIRGTPYAVVIGSASTGQVKLSRWRSEKPVGPPDERWSRK
jgi:prepilin-type N-terminal cleavage/methylation domain-containing protein